MKALVQHVYGSSDALELKDVDPPTVGADDVLIRVHAAAIHIGDWHVMAGRPYLMRVIGFGFRGPKVRIRGMDVSGRVEAVGSAVTDFRVGDEVFGVCDGSLAEFACARADKIALKPANLSFEQAASVPTSGVTALQALRDAGGVQPGQRVMIIGATGSVGSFAVQIAKALGAHVTAVCSTSGMELVRSIGADQVIDYTRDPELASDAEPFDLVLDTAGNRPLSQLRRILARQGTLVLVGGEGGGRVLGGMDRVLRASLLSGFGSQNLRGLISVDRADDLRSLTALIEAGKVMPVIEMTFSFDDCVDAFRRLEAGHSRGKIVVAL